MTTAEQFIAVNRFGLGPAPGEFDRVGADPRGWLRAQTFSAPELPPQFGRLRGSAAIARDIHRARLEGPETLQRMLRRGFRDDYGRGSIARIQHLVGTRQPFAERMVLFWSNHFTVSTAKRIIAPTIPAFEREAIRPHVFGSFADMLLAVTRHPTMLTYLDNFLSMGPESAAGRLRRDRSGLEATLNENLARELLELHTLGVDGGYTQQDVIELAKALSGWSHGGARRPSDSRPVHGEFEFNQLFHEPGTRTVLGRRYPQRGIAQGEAVLHDLARHPSTAKLIATKLLRHFVADEPDDRDVAHLAGVFLSTDGDLGAVTRALTDVESAWAEPLPRVKSHQDFLVASYRATGRSITRADDVIEPLSEFGQMPFSAPSPAGWPDSSAYWLSPESLLRRVEWSRQFAATLPSTLYPSEFLTATLGPVASDATRIWVGRAASPDEGNALVLASAEFQRR